MNTEELPTLKRLKKQLAGFEAIIQINGLLQCIGLGSKKITELQGKCDEISCQLTQFTEYPSKFNEFFSKSGWLAHESMSFEVLKRAVDEYESKGEDAATKILLDYYSPDQVEKRMFFFLGLEELRVRRKFIDYALAEHKAGRYYSAIPLLLMVIDGAVNDATGKGFHASDVNMNVWDSLTTADGAIYTIKDIFMKGRKVTSTEPINLPYRNGILHGMDLEYDNPIVATKCWCFLFVVRDWLVSKKSEAQRKMTFEKETKVLSLREIVDAVNRTNRFKQAIEAWKPRAISKEYIATLNNSLVAENGLPENAVLAFLSFWKQRNYGNMAKLLRTKVVDNPKKYAKEVREEFGSVCIVGYSIINIVDEAPVITQVDVRVTNSENDNTVSYWKFRLICEDDKGSPVPPSILGGGWRIMWIHQTNEQI